MCKDKVATIRLKEIINDMVTELQLCQACFEERELKGGGHAVGSVDKAMSALAGQTGAGKKADAKPLQCSTCGASEEDLKNNGRLGCGDCYDEFEVSIQPILTRVHNATEHRGKAPHEAARNLDFKVEMRRLQEDLQEAILSENYERAAKLRDKIRQFQDM